MASEYSGDQWPILVFGLLFGFLGSLIDSLLGATLQVTYYDKDKKCIVKNLEQEKYKYNKRNIQLISGIDVLSNEAVNFLSIAISMILAAFLGPSIFRVCYEVISLFKSFKFLALFFQLYISFPYFFTL